MKIFTTPMCQEVVRLAGVSKYTVKQENNFEGADLAIVLSETDTNIPSIKIKLNTFKQIYESIDLISNNLETEKLDSSEWEDDCFINVCREKETMDERKKIKVKVYSKFIREIVDDMGFSLVTEKPDFIVFPDYLKEDMNTDILREIEFMGCRAVEIPSHKNTPLNPLKRAQMRYNILESRLCTKP
jgi:segregation and condensation protein B